ncbi:DUF5050 domain-containing protein, partial [Candidatus Poribacteria bacterium]|nr:DUF5050 domain-containing protein [Candidatus Poribacteria bacterium]
MKTQRIRWALMAAAFLALTGGSRADLTGTKIVFDSNRSGNYDLYTVGPDGTGVTQLTNTAANERSPSYSPDGSRIYFTSDASGAANIYVMNADGTHPVRLTTTAGGDDGAPMLSPDGSKVAFDSNRDASWEIYVMAADGSGQTNLTNSVGVNDNYPRWSPDGQSILFATNRDTDWEIYTMDADGQNPVNRTNNAAAEGSAAFSLDGTQIVFDSDRTGEKELFVMDTATYNPSQVVVRAGSVESVPVWSPDGTRIVFQSEAAGQIDVYAIDPAGTNEAQLTTDAAADGSPSWSPFPAASTITVANTQGQAASSVTIPITITDATSLSVTGVSLGITYDAALLTPTGATPAVVGALIPAGWSIQQNIATAGLLQASLAGGFGEPLVGAGVLLNVTFDVAPAAAAGATSVVTLAQADLNEGQVTSGETSGLFTVLNLVYGDVTGNGAVTSFDASWVLEYVATDSVGDPVTLPIETSAPTWASSPLSNADAIAVADVDGDASVGAIDASLILQHDVELITEFPVEAPGAPSVAPVVGAYGLSGVASSTRPGARIVVTLDASDVPDLLAGELRLDFDPVALRAVTAYMGGPEGPASMLAHHAHEGRVGVAFAAARPIDAAGSSLHVVFEAARDLDDVRSGVIEASRLRLNGATY